MRIKLILLNVIILTSFTALVSFAGTWEKKYLADEFGDADYSKPIYCLLVDPVGGYGAAVNFYYVNGVFAIDFTDAYVCLCGDRIYLFYPFRMGNAKGRCTEIYQECKTEISLLLFRR